MKLKIIFFALALVLAGCGDDNSGVNPAQGGGNGNNGGGNGGNEGGGGATSSYFPLAKGNKWTFEFKGDGAAACTNSQDPHLEVTHATEAGGVGYYTVQGNTCIPYNGTFTPDGNGLKIGTITYLDGAPEAEKSWEYSTSGIIHTWIEEITEYETKAGKFKNCWSFEKTSELWGENKEYHVVCPGVGLVYMKNDGLMVEATLIEKNF